MTEGTYALRRDLPHDAIRNRRRDDGQVQSVASIVRNQRLVLVPAAIARTKDLVAILIVASLAILAGLGNGTFWEPDEPRFAEATRQMFQRGDFATPYLNGVPRFEKPILFYWTQAVSFAAFGDNEFAARLPSALAGIGIVLVVYL